MKKISIILNKKYNELIQLFKKIVFNSFANNLNFAFIFGSVAKYDAFDNGRESDIDTFVCVKNRKKDEESSFLDRLRDLHSKYFLKIDEQYPSEILSSVEIKNILNDSSLNSVTINHYNDDITFDKVFYTSIFNDKKTGVVFGDKEGEKIFEELNSFAKSKKYFLKKWADQVKRLYVNDNKFDIVKDIEERIKNEDYVYILRKYVKFPDNKIYSRYISTDKSILEEIYDYINSFSHHISFILSDAISIPYCSNDKNITMV